jgi:hypothetical protein
MQFRLSKPANPRHSSLRDSISNDGKQCLVVGSSRQNRPVQIRAFSSAAFHAVASRAHSQEKLLALGNIRGVLGRPYRMCGG